MSHSKHDNSARFRPRNPARRRGFSMAEAALAVMVVGLMMVTALNMVGMSARARSVNAQLGKGPALAHGLLNEVLQSFYQEPDAVGDPVVGPEVELSSHGPNPTVPKDCGLWDDRYVGQVFRPTLPPDAVSWEVTRVTFQAKSVDSTDGIATVQLRTLDDSSMPSMVVLEEHPMPESDLSSTYTWQAFEYSTVTDLVPGSGLALVVAVQKNDADVCAVLTDNNGGSGLVTTSNAGVSWSVSSTKGVPHYVYGRITTEQVTGKSLGPEPSESTDTRSDFDDVDDYNGWSSSPPEERDGTILADYAGWTRSVSVEYIDPVKPGGTSTDADNGAKRITVTVTDPLGAETQVVSVRSNLGTHEQEVSATKTYVSWVGLDLQVGAGNAAVSLGTAMPNEPLAK